jgi:hypothetical protein
MAHHRPMMLDGRQRLVDLGFVVGEHVEAGDDPALDLGLASLHDAGVGFEQTEHLLARRHRLPLQHPPLRLVDGLLDEGEEAVELDREPSGQAPHGAGRSGRTR